MCLFPRLIKNKKYEPNKKNRGIVPDFPVGKDGNADMRVLAVPIKCGECMECRKQNASQWKSRLKEDIRHNTNAKWVTLTFSNESIKKLYEKYEDINTLKGYDVDNAIATKAVRLFLERWRKKYGVSLRHWFVTELGHNGTENIHMHGFIWTDEPMETVEKIWSYGFMWKGKKWKGAIINYVSEKTINYTVKYVMKRDELHKGFKSIVLTSAGIGKGYTERADVKRHTYKGAETIRTYKAKNGTENTIPIYWRNKIWSEAEREKLWLETLDKEIRYVDGIEIDVSKGNEPYYAALREARLKNRRLGYGTDTERWTRKQYEEQRRELMLEKRIGKTALRESIKNGEFQMPRSKEFDWINPREQVINGKYTEQG